MNEDKEFQKKVQVAVDSYLGRKDKQSLMAEQIQNVLEREQLIDQVQRLIVELITKLTERFITNMKKQVENEILKLRETIRSTHQRTYSAVDKEKVEDQVQRTLNKHDVQINMLLEHQAQLKQMRSEATGNDMKERVGKYYQEGLRSLEVRIGGAAKILLEELQLYLYYVQWVLEKQQTIMQILNDLVVKIEKIELSQSQQQMPIVSDKKKR